MRDEADKRILAGNADGSFSLANVAEDIERGDHHEKDQSDD
jgi:hypothetical protein